MDVDLASIPANHLVALASYVDVGVDINNVSNCDIVSFFDNVKCGQIEISRQRLSSEETQGLVRPMDNVERVELGFVGDVSLDIITLTQYSGQ